MTRTSPVSSDRCADGASRLDRESSTQPLWARNGRELFYLSLEGSLMSVPVVPGKRRRQGLAKDWRRDRRQLGGRLRLGDAWLEPSDRGKNQPAGMSSELESPPR